MDKQRRLDNNLQEAKVPSKVEVGAVWSEQPEAGANAGKASTVATKGPDPAIHGGHFTVPVR